MIVYEFVGYLNSVCNGVWYEDFPYRMDGTHVEPRTTFYDATAGGRSSENWQAYVVSGKIHTKENWVGQWPEGADYITTSPIQKVTYNIITFPRYILVKGNNHCIHTDCNSQIVVWSVETVTSFLTAEGKTVQNI